MALKMQTVNKKSQKRSLLKPQDTQDYELHSPLLNAINVQLTSVSQMEIGCSRIWGLVTTTQTQVGGKSHKPALPATQPRSPPATPDPKQVPVTLNSEFNGKTHKEGPWLP